MPSSSSCSPARDASSSSVDDQRLRFDPRQVGPEVEGRDMVVERLERAAVDPRAELADSLDERVHARRSVRRRSEATHVQSVELVVVRYSRAVRLAYA
jgi:hypothetical protein